MLSAKIIGNDVAVADLEGTPSAANRAMVRSMNRGITAGRASMIPLISGDIGFKQAIVRDAVPLRRATLGNPQASFGASLKRIPLIKFGVTQAPGGYWAQSRGRWGFRKAGLTYSIGPGGRRTLPHAFIATTSSGHTGVFERKGKSRLPIRQLYGPSLGHVFEKYREIGLTRTREAFLENMPHELAFAKTEAKGAGV